MSEKTLDNCDLSTWCSTDKVVTSLLTVHNDEISRYGLPWLSKEGLLHELGGERFTENLKVLLNVPELH